LLFHGIETTEEPSELKRPGDLLYVLDSGVLGAILSRLREEGYVSCRLRDARAWQRGERQLPEKSVVLSFDDGHASNVTHALHLLRKEGFVGEFFVTTGKIGTMHRLTAAQGRLLTEGGMGVGSYGVTHRYLTDLTESENDEELLRLKEILEDCTGAPIMSFSAPGGTINPRIANGARNAGYESVCGSRPSAVRKKRDDAIQARFAVSRGVELGFTSSKNGREGGLDGSGGLLGLPTG